MKTFRIFLSVCLVGISFQLAAQIDCQVLIPELSGEYFGKCKEGLAQGKGKALGRDTYEGHFSKGLPQGDGTYIWANGDSYTGQWEQGLRHGLGTLKYKSNGKDTVLAGIWEEDNTSARSRQSPA